MRILLINEYILYRRVLDGSIISVTRCAEQQACCKYRRAAQTQANSGQGLCGVCSRFDPERQIVAAELDSRQGCAESWANHDANHEGHLCLFKTNQNIKPRHVAIAIGCARI